MTLKTCSKCKQEKNIDDFHYQKWGKFSRKAACKSCRNKENKKYKRNIEKDKISNRLYYKKNKERIKKAHQEYRNKNRELIRLWNKNRRYKNKGAIGVLTKESLDARFNYYGYRCKYCGSGDKLTIDHRIPLSRGGTNLPANIVPACQSCNSSKNNKTEKEFRHIDADDLIED